MMLDRVAPIVAHGNGWDEILMFAVPIVLVILAVLLLERRARRKSRKEEAE